MARQTNQDIFDRIRSVETTLTKLCVTMESVDANQTKLLEKHDKTLYGNGKTGLDTRVDRIEQVEKGRKWNLRVVWGAIVGLCGRIAYDVFR